MGSTLLGAIFILVSSKNGAVVCRARSHTDTPHSRSGTRTPDLQFVMLKPVSQCPAMVYLSRASRNMPASSAAADIAYSAASSRKIVPTTSLNAPHSRGFCFHSK